MSQCSGSIKGIQRVSLILDDDEQPEELGLTGLTASEKQSGERRFNVDMMRLMFPVMDCTNVQITNRV